MRQGTAQGKRCEAAVISQHSRPVRRAISRLPDGRRIGTLLCVSARISVWYWTEPWRCLMAVFVFRPGGVQQDNVFTNWETLVDAMLTVEGRKILEFDDSIM